MEQHATFILREHKQKQVKNSNFGKAEDTLRQLYSGTNANYLRLLFVLKWKTY